MRDAQGNGVRRHGTAADAEITASAEMGPVSVVPAPAGWEALGCEGWNWNNVLPYFRKSEGNVRGSDRVVLGAKARVTGDVTYGVIEMTLGARVDGRLIPLSATAATAIEPTGAVTPSGTTSADPAETSRADNVLRPFELRQGRN